MKPILIVVTLFAGLSLALPRAATAAINVVSYWRMGENDPGAVPGTTGANVTDSIGSRNLTFSGPALYSTDVAAAASAHTGSSLSVNLSAAGAYGLGSLVSTATDNFGVEAWVKPVSVTSGQVIAYNGNTATTGWGILVSGSTYLGLFGGKDIFGSGVATSNVWTHVAMVRSGGVATIYINGTAAGTSSVIPNLPTGNFAIGAPPQSPIN